MLIPTGSIVVVVVVDVVAQSEILVVSPEYHVTLDLEECRDGGQLRGSFHWMPSIGLPVPCVQEAVVGCLEDHVETKRTREGGPATHPIVQVDAVPGSAKRDESIEGVIPRDGLEYRRCLLTPHTPIRNETLTDRVLLRLRALRAIHSVACPYQGDPSLTQGRELRPGDASTR